MRRLLVLWDVDYTLIDSNGVGRELYQTVFGEMFGRDMPQPGSMAGRTDRAIVAEVLTLAGVDDPRQHVDAFHRLMAAHAPGLADRVAERTRILPGAAEAMAALARLDGRGVIQSLLTGNLPELARVKLSALQLTEHLDLTIGAYGDISAVRADLVQVAQAKAAARHGGDFTGRYTILVGDTPSDVEAALANGASAVAVASGSFSADDLAQAGAHVVLPDLADTPAALHAILGAPEVAAVA